jgi:hypothetical protein
LDVIAAEARTVLWQSVQLSSWKKGLAGVGQESAASEAGDDRNRDRSSGWRGMNPGHNHYDVSESVDVADPVAVDAEVKQTFLARYPGASTSKIDQAFRDIDALYHGRFPGYHSCDTGYHDIQHVLDVTLAMARLMDGYERADTGRESFDAPLFCLGIVTALFHDCGYVRELGDRFHRNGGELTLTHVSRGARFLQRYLPQIGMGDVADIAATLVHFTGYEIPVAQIKVPTTRYKLLGSMLGSADIIAQMSDRCYLEKCRDRLYPEFVAAGIARKRLPDGKEEVIYKSGEDLVKKTPNFYQGAMQRLEGDLGACYRYAGYHFGGRDLYLARIDSNVRFAAKLGEAGSQELDGSMLKRAL